MYVYASTYYIFICIYINIIFISYHIILYFILLYYIVLYYIIYEYTYVPIYTYTPYTSVFMMIVHELYPASTSDGQGDGQGIDHALCRRSGEVGELGIWDDIWVHKQPNRYTLHYGYPWVGRQKFR